MEIITAYTDGSAVVVGKNKGHGGFGTYFPNLFGNKKAWSNGFLQTKTGRMEIMALFYAIKAIPVEYSHWINLVVFTDSQYVEKSFSEGRLERWKNNNWINTAGEVKNKDMWKVILREIAMRPYLKLDLKHIKSHQLDKEKDPEKRKQLSLNPHIVGNAVADKLADHKRHKNKLKSDLIW